MRREPQDYIGSKLASQRLVHCAELSGGDNAQLPAGAAQEFSFVGEGDLSEEDMDEAPADAMPLGGRWPNSFGGVGARRRAPSQSQRP